MPSGEPERRLCRACGAAVPPNAPFGHCPRCLVELGFGTLPDDAAPARHRRLGEYELLEQIGRGGMGVVYKARQVSLKRLVALKMLGPHSSAFPGIAERLRVEAEVAGALRHPQIVTIYDVGEHDGHPFFTMELIEGSGLDRFIGPDGFRPGTATPDTGRRAGPEAAAARVMVKIARAVDHAHKRGVLHRDLKPANILLDTEGEPHLTDFGLAKVLNRVGVAATSSGAILGTPSYMAPEQASGGSRNVSVAADVFSLGAILYEMLTGRPPFRAETPLETLRRVVEEPPKPPTTFNQRIDRDLAIICLKCLEKDPAHRYDSALAVAEDLEHWLRREPIAARSARRLERLWRWTRREPVLAGLLAGSVLLLLLVAGLSGHLYRQELVKGEARSRDKRTQISRLIDRLAEGQDPVRFTPRDLFMLSDHPLVVDGGEVPVTLGIVAQLRKPDEVLQSIAPLVIYLQTNLLATTSPRVSIHLLIFKNRSNALNALLNGSVDLIRVDPADYVQLRSRAHVVPLVKQSSAVRGSSHLVLFARADAGIDQLKDLRGKRVALGERSTALGEWLPMAVLVDHGLRARDFARLTNDHSAAVIAAVRQGRFDAGVAERDDYENAIAFQNRLLPETGAPLKLIFELRCPAVPWVAADGLEKPLAEAIGASLRRFRSSDAPLPFDPKLGGFESVSPSEYDELETRMNQARVFGD